MLLFIKDFLNVNGGMYWESFLLCKLKCISLSPPLHSPGLVHREHQAQADSGCAQSFTTTRRQAL